MVALHDKFCWLPGMTSYAGSLTLRAAWKDQLGWLSGMTSFAACLAWPALLAAWYEQLCLLLA